VKILVLVEHTNGALRLGSRSAFTFARQVAESLGGSIECLLLGSQLDAVAQAAALYAPVHVTDYEALAAPVADRHAQAVAQVVRNGGFGMFVAASGTYAKDVVSRAGGMLGGAMASEVVGHEISNGQLLLRRPVYAGAVTATVILHGSPQTITVRPSAYPAAEPSSTVHSITSVAIDEAALPDGTRYIGLASKRTGRPDVTEARIVVSGGRALKDSDDFERLVGGLADRLGAATGSSRALVDAGITPNELQVGQTGKVVAPDLYIALGISGAVQHLAGMKNSKVIVAINSDPEAPIFELADYGLVGDVYEVVPQLIKLLSPAS
jgi:electron transfer flavoprotein alpha subunit